MAVKQSILNISIVCTCSSPSGNLNLFFLVNDEDPAFSISSTKESISSESKCDIRDNLYPEISLASTSLFEDDSLNITRAYFQNTAQFRDRVFSAPDSSFLSSSFRSQLPGASGALNISNWSNQSHLGGRISSSGSTGSSRFRSLAGSGGSAGSRSNTPTEAILAIRRTSSSFSDSSNSRQSLSPSPLQSLGLIGSANNRGAPISGPVNTSVRQDSSSAGKLNEALQNLLGATGNTLDASRDVNSSPRSASAASPHQNSAPNSAQSSSFTKRMAMPDLTGSSQSGLKLCPVATIASPLNDTQPKISFSGDFGVIGGLMLHILYPSSGLYYGYSLQRSETDFTLSPVLNATNDMNIISKKGDDFYPVYVPISSVTSIAHCSSSLKRIHRRCAQFPECPENGDNVVPISVLTSLTVGANITILNLF